ncbi:MAG: M48 family metallopeptidase [Dehalococcoidia bacterium]|nr:M48 family metallopeptidase [Dehalococcoidia bacterium]
MPDLNFDGLSVDYEIVRCARKTLGVVISPNGVVVARAPFNASRADIVDFVERSKPWIFKHLARYRQVYRPRDFTSGEDIPYLGKKYKLKVISDGAGTPLALVGSRLEIHVAHDLEGAARRKAVKQIIVCWYTAQARQVLTTRLCKLACRLGICPTAVKVKHQVRRWGSCTASGVINLNWQLIMAPAEVIDYVIVHELCHLRVHGHQQEFWQCIGQYMPDYKKRRKWLRENGQALSFLLE